MLGIDDLRRKHAHLRMTPHKPRQVICADLPIHSLVRLSEHRAAKSFEDRRHKTRLCGYTNERVVDKSLTLARNHSFMAIYQIIDGSQRLEITVNVDSTIIVQDLITSQVATPLPRIARSRILLRFVVQILITQFRCRFGSPQSKRPFRMKLAPSVQISLETLRHRRPTPPRVQDAGNHESDHPSRTISEIGWSNKYEFSVTQCPPIRPGM